MITKCIKDDENRVVTYIGDNYPFCLYLYLDLLKYGIESDLINVYFQKEKDEIKSILLSYYSCLHVFSRDNEFEAKEIADFFCTNHFTMLYCTVVTADRVYSAFPQSVKSHATVTKGWVAQIETIDREPQGLAVPAEKLDFEQIAKLIYEDEGIGRSYKLDDLAKQLEERNQEGYSRNLVIKSDDLVIAHACTNADYNGIAVVAELMVRKEFRKRGYASEIWREICSQLLSEEKKVYSIYYSNESKILHKHIGFHEICEWEKIVIV